MTETRLEERAGELILAGFEGTNVSAPAFDEMTPTAGAIVFARNVASRAETAALVRGIRDAFARAGEAAPLIAIDEEGGRVSRLGALGPEAPSAMALGAIDDTSLTEAVYREVGAALAALDIGLDLAPVADIVATRGDPIIGTRSFGDDPSAVARHVAAAIAGLHRSGVAATAKHFPGHGAAQQDSHVAQPVIDFPAAAIRERALPPFAAAIAAGVDAVMTAHVAFPGIDPSGTPASLSRAITTGLLRETMGFDGVICTDCLQMGALADRGVDEAAVAALAAGADLVLLSTPGDDVIAARDAIRAAIVSGRLDRREIERSMTRVRALRERYAAAGAGLAERGDASKDARARAVTLVRDSAPVVPLRLEAGARLFVVQFVGEASTRHEPTAKRSTAFGEALARGPARVQEQLRSLDPAGHEYKQLLMASGAADAIVAVTRDARAHPLQAQAVGDLALAGKPLIVVAASTPYDAIVAPPDAAVIATFGDDDVSLGSAAAVILGERVANARLPIDLGGPATAAAPGL